MAIIWINETFVDVLKDVVIPCVNEARKTVKKKKEKQLSITRVLPFVIQATMSIF